MMGYQRSCFIFRGVACIINSVLSIKIFITNYTAADRYQQLKCLDHIISLTNDLLFK